MSTVSSRIKCGLAASAVGGALIVAAAGPAGASTVGLLKASQLPSGYKSLGRVITIPGSSLVKSTKSLGGGVGLATSNCKGAPGAASLKGVTAHIAAFGKEASTKSVSILGEVVLETPSAAAAAKYFATATSVAAGCAGTETLKEDGTSITITFKAHNTTIPRNGADAAVGTVLALSAKTSEMGVKVSVAGSLGIQTYRKGADVVEILVDNFGVKASGKSGSVTFTPGSAALVSTVGKAAVADL